MIDKYGISDLFGIAAAGNILVAILVSCVFLYFFKTRRFEFVKPTTQVIAVSHLFFQWPFALYAGYYVTWLPRPLEMMLLVHGFIIGGLALSTFGFGAVAQDVWGRFGRKEFTASGSALGVGFGASIIVSIVLAWIYLSYVPITSTPLYVFFTEPHLATQAREAGLKLLADPVPRYAYSFLSSALLLLNVAFAAKILQVGIRTRQATLVVAAILVICFALVLAFLTATKGNLAKIAPVLMAVYIWESRLTLSLKNTFLAMGAVVGAVLPILLINIFFWFNPPQTDSIAGPIAQQEGVSGIGETPSHGLEAVQPDSEFMPPGGEGEIVETPVSVIVMGQLEAALKRAFVTPLQVGGWYVHYGQESGFFGFAGIPKLALLIDVEPAAASSVVAQRYAPEYYGRAVASSTTSPSGFLFSYYSYFGLWSLPLSVSLVFLLNVILLVGRWLSPPLATVMISVFSVQALMLIQADFTTALVTHGILVSILFCIGAEVLVRLWRAVSLRRSPNDLHPGSS